MSSESFVNYKGAIQPKGFMPLPEDWTSEVDTLITEDGKAQLFSVLHHQKNWKNPRALIIVHGLGEHGGRYLHFPHYLKEVIGAVYIVDLRGHGRSNGTKGFIEEFDLYADDVALAIRKLNERLKLVFKSSEIHLLGHSMGGLIVLRSLLKYSDLPLYSAAVSAPFMGIAAKAPAAKKAAAHVLSKIWGSLHMSTGLDASHISHDAEVVAAYTSDRLVHDKITPKLFTELLRVFDDTKSRSNGIPYALQFMIPLEDKIVDSHVSMEFAKDLSNPDKNLITYEGFYHEIFNEMGKEKVFGDLISWIKKHHA